MQTCTGNINNPDLEQMVSTNFKYDDYTGITQNKYQNINSKTSLKRQGFLNMISNICYKLYYDKPEPIVTSH